MRVGLRAAIHSRPWQAQSQLLSTLPAADPFGWTSRLTLPGLERAGSLTRAQPGW
jgi:hypothetical protein